jgi:hypothetical protein
MKQVLEYWLETADVALWRKHKETALGTLSRNGSKINSGRYITDKADFIAFLIHTKRSERQKLRSRESNTCV